MLGIVLIDDENIVLRGMSHLLNKHYPEHKIIGMFENGYDALELVRNSSNIDVIITDIKMPNINGICLIQEIKEINSEIFIIALSSYSDYDFVRHSMLNGAYDYLLKPCKPSDVCALLSKIQQIKNNRNIEKQYLLYEHQLYNLITGNSQDITIFEDKDNVQMVLISPLNIEDDCVFNVIENDFTTIYPDACGSIRYKNHIMVIFKNHSNITENNKVMQHFVNNMNYKRVKLTCSLFEFTYAKISFPEAYKVSSCMIEFAEFNQCNLILNLSIYKKYIEQQKVYIFSDYFKRQTVIKYIIESNSRSLSDYIDIVIEKLYNLSVYFDPIKIKKDITHELLNVEDYISNYYADMLKDQKYDDIIQQINDSSTFGEACTNLKNILLMMCSHYDSIKGTPKYIINAISYIEVNYMKDISLKDVADHVYLNPWYFSTQFKKHVEISMNEYLNSVRIRFAKELLKDNSLMIYQVAEMVGFNDPAYFSTVFKRIENITPQQYHKSC